MNKNNFLSDISYFLLNIDEQKRKYVIKNVLYSTGLNMEDYHKRFDGDLKTDFPIIEQYIKQNMLVEKNNRIFLTQSGMAKSDYIGPTFMSKEILEFMQNMEG